jgi:predicted Zn-dependent protease
MALVGNDSLFASSFQQYEELLNESTVITDTADARLVERVGQNIRIAAEKWLASEGHSEYLDQYRWEYHLVADDAVNAWCMPGGKIVVYTGILPVTQNADALATVLGHEVAHALLNHGQQQSSAGILQEIGLIGVGVATMNKSEETQQLATGVYGVGSNVLGMLPFSRKHETEADEIGLILMAIAGYNPDAAVPFWERMGALGGSTPPQFLSTHPSPETRIADIKRWTPEARKKAAQLSAGVK